MTGSAGRPYRAIPGPSVIPDEVLAAMHRAAPDIYSEEMAALTEELIAGLKGLARTAHDVAIYICNGHGTWEASLTNVIAPGSRVLVLATGVFGHGWAGVAESLGTEVEIMEFGRASPADPARLEERLRADRAHQIKAVLVTHTDTATSVRNDLAALTAARDAAGHPALMMADCIASLGCDRFEMDACGIDIAIAASQKGLMLPPGLGFVFFNPRAAEARARLARVSRYWDWRPRVAPAEFYQYFAGTAPTHHLFGLQVALKMIAEEGIEAVWTRHERLARAIWAACAHWGQGGRLRLTVEDPAHRSHAVTALSLGAPDGARLRAWLARETGVTLGIGLGMATDDDPRAEGFFRIGHMGHVNAHMVLGVLGAIEAGLCALGIAHAPGGASAAAEHLARG